MKYKFYIMKFIFMNAFALLLLAVFAASDVTYKSKTGGLLTIVTAKISLEGMSVSCTYTISMYGGFTKWEISNLELVQRLKAVVDDSPNKRFHDSDLVKRSTGQPLKYFQEKIN